VQIWLLDDVNRANKVSYIRTKEASTISLVISQMVAIRLNLPATLIMYTVFYIFANHVFGGDRVCIRPACQNPACGIFYLAYMVVWRILTHVNCSYGHLKVLK